MKKIAFSLLACGLLLSATEAFAGMRTLAEWNGGTPSAFTQAPAKTPQAPRDMTIDGGADSATGGMPMTAEEYCPKACPGYSADITECDEGYEPQVCKDYDCGNYYKCVVVTCQEGYDTSYKDCPISVQDDNFRCTKCIQ